MKQWYFIHTYSGHENKVVESLHARIRDMELDGQITEVLLPKETVVEMRGNKRIESSRLLATMRGSWARDSESPPTRSGALTAAAAALVSSDLESVAYTWFVHQVLRVRRIEL